MKNYYFLFSFRPKSVPNSPSIPRAFSNLRHQLTSAWSGSGKKKQSGGASANQALSSDDKKKWQSSQDCASKSLSRNKKVVLDEIDLRGHSQMTSPTYGYGGGRGLPKGDISP